MAGETSRPRLKWHTYTGHGERNGAYRGGVLAEDGCPNSQVALAAQLLEPCDDRSDQIQNDRLAVYWLIKASEQGHEGATRMLQNCLDTKRGINRHNISDVKACLSMPPEEKVSRFAARELFTNLSQGEDFITSEQLIEELQEATGIEVNHEKGTPTQSDVDSSYDPTFSPGSYATPCKITEDMLTAAASDHAKGQLPLVHRVLTLENPEFGQPLLLRSSSLRSIISTYYDFIHSIGRRPLRDYIPPTGSTECRPTLIFLFVFFVLANDWTMEALPIFLYYSTLIVMMITTCQILSRKWEYNQFQQWSNLLVSWGGQRVNPQQAQWAFTYNNIYPCFVFLVSLILHILISPLIPIRQIPHSELVVLSVISSFLVLYNYAWYKNKLDYLALFSFGVTLLARYPYEIDSVVSFNWRFMDAVVPTFASYVVGNGIEFCLNCRVVFYLLMPGLLFKMAFREKWRGVYTSLVPHLVCLSWWQLAVFISSGATKFGVIRTVLAITGGIVILPIAGVTLALIPAAAVLRFFIVTETIIPISVPLTIAALCLSILLYISTRTGKVVSWLQMGLGIAATFILVFPQLEIVPKDWDSGAEADTALTWERYSSFCSFRDREMSIESQEKCLSLIGLPVHWEGVVTSATIASVHNPISSILSKFPLMIRNVFFCMFGSRYEICEEDSNGECSVPPYLQDKCHLSNWNRYEYIVAVKMTSWAHQGTIDLSAGHLFTNYTSTLRPGDRIWFSGILEPGSESLSKPDPLRVRIWSSGCVSCSSPAAPSQFPPPSSMYTLGRTCLNHLLNFLFNPLVTFK